MPSLHLCQCSPGRLHIRREGSDAAWHRRLDVLRARLEHVSHSASNERRLSRTQRCDRSGQFEPLQVELGQYDDDQGREAVGRRHCQVHTATEERTIS